MKVKVCGITNADDAHMAAELGADYLGLIFAAESPRAVNVATARAILSTLTRVLAVGVFVEQSLAEIERTAAELNLHAVQLYGRYRHLPRNVVSIRAVRVRDGRSLATLRNGHGTYILLDFFHPGRSGGNGASFDWSLLPTRLDRVFLAGGIGPDNVRAAALRKPFALDVCSRVEKRPGLKDPDKLRRLFEEIRS